MFNNYLKIAFRNLWKNKGYTAVNISGLAIGLTCFLLLLLYLNYEFSYDLWNPQLKQVFRISMISDNGDYNIATPEPLGFLLQQNSPGIKHITRVEYLLGGSEILFSANDKDFYIHDIATADSAFFSVFPYKLLLGDRRTVLQKPGSLVLTPEVSHLLFGNENPIGKTVKIYNSFTTTVTGVMAAPKGPSVMPIKAIWLDPFLAANNHWSAFVYSTFVLSNRPVSSDKLEEKLNEIYYKDHIKRGNKTFDQYRAEGHKAALVVDALPDLHNFPKYEKSNIHTVWILFLLAILLLLSGIASFTNLSVASNMSRSREIGVRKVLGTSQLSLIIQFMIEMAIQCTIALLLSLILTKSLLPLFNNTYNLHLSLWNNYRHFNIFGQIGIALLAVIVLSGIYPAVFLYRFKPSVVLKGSFSGTSKGKFFRNILIILQFAISIFFIIGILIIYSQVHYMRTRDLGLQTSQLISIKATQETRDKKFYLIKNKLLRIPGIETVAKATMVPGSTSSFDTSTFKYLHAGKTYHMSVVKVSADYFKAIGAKIVAGRGFSTTRPIDTISSIILNESAVKKLRLKNPIGTSISTAPTLCQTAHSSQVIGVVNDFHVAGFNMPILPTIYSIANYCPWISGGAILVKLNPRNISETLESIKSEWKQIEPGFPIRYSFVDEDFAKLLQKYNRLEKLILSFSIIAILIALMGLFSLVAFMTEGRTKEIAIRKVLGASFKDILQLINKSFLILIVIANVIVWPIIYTLAQKWLNGFAYRIDLPLWPFIIAAAVSVALTIITVSLVSWRAAKSNPVDALKFE